MVSVPALYDMFTAYLRVIVWRPLLPIHSFNRSSSYFGKRRSSYFGKRKKLMPLNWPNVAIIHTSLHYISSHRIQYMTRFMHSAVFVRMREVSFCALNNTLYVRFVSLPFSLVVLRRFIANRKRKFWFEYGQIVFFL